MTTRKSILVSLAITLVVLVSGLLRLANMPEMVPTHWDANGNINGWSPKAFAVWFMPGIMLLFTGLLVVLPKMSPKAYDPLDFILTFNQLWVITIGMMGFIQVVTLQAAIDPKFDSGKWIIVGIMLGFALIGNLMGKVRQNHWMGIRVPWTLSNREVWDQTHRMAGRLWVVSGVVCSLMVLVGLPIWLAFTLFMISTVWPIFSSYFLWKRLENH
ncbi:MAG: SdpI family protein [Fimbriimonas sp.]